MPRKTKQKQKQRQHQSQKVVVNIGVREKNKNKSKRRRHRKSSDGGVSGAAREYAQAISQIIPRIQYNFPQHSSFNYDRDTKDYGVHQQEISGGIQRPMAVQPANPVQILAPPTANEATDFNNQVKIDVAQQKEFENKAEIKNFMINPKEETTDLKIPKPVPVSAGDNTPSILNAGDKTPSLLQGFNEFAKNEAAPLVGSGEAIRKPTIRKPNKPSSVMISNYLKGKELAETPENKQIAEQVLRKAKESGLSTSTISKMMKKAAEKKDKELERSGMASRLKPRPTRERSPSPTMSNITTSTIPILGTPKVTTLADVAKREATSLGGELIESAGKRAKSALKETATKYVVGAITSGLSKLI